MRKRNGTRDAAGRGRSLKRAQTRAPHAIRRNGSRPIKILYGIERREKNQAKVDR